jgi:excisionase family DNA binding protein
MAMLTLKEAAQELGIAIKTLRNWVGAEKIEYVQYGDGGRILFRRATIEGVIAASTTPARDRKRGRPAHMMGAAKAA